MAQAATSPAAPASPAAAVDPKTAAADPAAAAAKPAVDPNAARFAEVTRLQTENLTLKRQLAPLQTKLQSLEKAGVDVNALRAEAKTNPLKVMKSLGLDFKEVAEFVIANKEGVPDPVKEELERLKAKDAERDAKETQREQQQKEAERAQQINSAKVDIKAFIDKDSGYELLKVYESASGETGADLVFGIMVEHYKRTGAALNEGDAAAAAEDWLAEYGEKLAGTGKVQSRLKAKQEAAAKAAAEADAAAKASGKGKATAKGPDAKKPGATLTNKETAASSAATGDEIDKALPGSKHWDARVKRATAKALAAQAQA